MEDRDIWVSPATKQIINVLCNTENAPTTKANVLLYGIGGLGKTYCAQEVFAHEDVQRVFQQRRFYLNFSDSAHAADVFTSALSSMPRARIDHAGGDQHVIERFLERLDALYGNQRVLLVLDGLDRVSGTNPALYERLKAIACSDTPERRHSVLAVSRLTDDLGAIWTATFCPRVSEYQATQCLEDICSAAGVKTFDDGCSAYSLHKETDLCRLVSFHPLSIRLLAARLIESGGDLNLVMHRLRMEGAAYVSLPADQRKGDRFDSLAACFAPEWETPKMAEDRKMAITVAQKGRAAEPPDADTSNKLKVLGLMWNYYCYKAPFEHSLHPAFVLYAQTERGGTYAAHERKGQRPEYTCAEEMELLP